MTQRKKVQRWIALSSATLGVLGAGLVAKSFLPLRLKTATDVKQAKEALSNGPLPDVEVDFLCCANINVPAWLAVRGAFSRASLPLVYGAVLIRHPKGTFLFDTGLCANIQHLISDQPLWFRKVFGNFVLEQSIGAHLQQRHMQPHDLDFILLSHLHWDHVSGIPDLPGVPLRVNRVEQKGLQKGPLAQNRRLVKRLLCNNPIELFDVNGPSYAGFQASHDLFGDGSIILVPLPGHTAGQVGMFIHRANGPHLFLIADAAWLAENYMKPAPMHPLFWSLISSDRAAALQTLIDLHRFAHQYPEIPMIAMHDAPMQEAFAQKGQAIPQTREVKRG